MSDNAQRVKVSSLKSLSFLVALAVTIGLLGGCVDSTRYNASTSGGATTDTASVLSSDTPTTTPTTAPATPTGPGIMKVHFFDVGEGDSTFFELPDGKTMLIDAGKTNEGPAVVQDIKGLGYKKIDYLITSHPDADHIGGVPAVLGAFSISEVWAPRVTHTTTTYESFLDAVKDKGLSIRTAQAGKQIGSAAQYSVDILSPVAGATYRNLNDWSVIIKVTHKKNTLLFVGDASSDVILAAGSGPVDLYKVGHHGSKTSTNAAVIESLASEYNVISVGKNSYGHPTDLVLKLLSKYQVYRTDHSGTVIAYSDGNNITFSTKSSAHQAPASEANKTSQRVYAR